MLLSGLFLWLGQGSKQLLGPEVSLPLSAVVLLSGHTLSGFPVSLPVVTFIGGFTMFLKSDDCRDGNSSLCGFRDIRTHLGAILKNTFLCL